MTPILAAAVETTGLPVGPMPNAQFQLTRNYRRDKMFYCGFWAHRYRRMKLLQRYWLAS